MAIPSFLNRNNIAAALQGLSVGLMGYGSGNPNAGLLAVGAVGDEKRRREQSELQRMEMERLQRQDAAEAAKETERKARNAAAQSMIDRIIRGDSAPLVRQGPGPARFPGQPTAGGFGGGMNITPQQAAVMQGLEPLEALALFGKEVAFPETKEVKPIEIGGVLIDPTTYKPVADYSDVLRRNAAAGKQDIIDEWETYTDQLSGRTGQKNKRTGKIDWDPGNTVLTQVGTDAQGNPIMEMQSISGRGATEKPPAGYKPTPTGLEPIPGGPADPGRLTDTQRNEYKKQSLALKNLETAVDRYDALIKQYGTTEFGATGRAELNNAYADLKIQMKEAANLGALTGPDIGVLQDMIIEPNSISGAWTGTEGTGKQIEQMKAQIAQKRTNLDALYNPSSAMGQPDGQNGVIEWERDPATGKPRRKVSP